jgi:hypothetical protein
MNEYSIMIRGFYRMMNDWETENEE